MEDEGETYTFNSQNYCQYFDAKKVVCRKLCMQYAFNHKNTMANYLKSDRQCSNMEQ